MKILEIKDIKKIVETVGYKSSVLFLNKQLLTVSELSFKYTNNYIVLY